MPLRIPTDLPEASPMIIAETETHVVIAVEIAKATLAHHRRFLETLLEAAGRAGNGRGDAGR
jgi:Ribonuclease G/E